MELHAGCLRNAHFLRNLIIEQLLVLALSFCCSSFTFIRCCHSLYGLAAPLSHKRKARFCWVFVSSHFWLWGGGDTEVCLQMCIWVFLNLLRTLLDLILTLRVCSGAHEGVASVWQRGWGLVLGKHAIELEELEGGTHHALVQKLLTRCQGLNRLWRFGSFKAKCSHSTASLPASPATPWRNQLTPSSALQITAWYRKKETTIDPFGSGLATSGPSSVVLSMAPHRSQRHVRFSSPSAENQLPFWWKSKWHLVPHE